jgi:hypothetical protein
MRRLVTCGATTEVGVGLTVFPRLQAAHHNRASTVKRLMDLDLPMLFVNILVSVIQWRRRMNRATVNSGTFTHAAWLASDSNWKWIPPTLFDRVDGVEQAMCIMGSDRSWMPGPVPYRVWSAWFH